MAEDGIHWESHSEMVEDLVKPGEEILASLDPGKAHLLHMLLALPGEVGELVDALKKWLIYGKDLDLENLLEEMGDIEFYLEGIRQYFGMSREQALDHNLRKLSRRYGSGKYSDQQAKDRADKGGSQ